MNGLQSQKKLTRFQLAMIGTASVFLLGIAVYAVSEYIEFERALPRMSFIRISSETIATNSQIQSIFGSPILTRGFSDDPKAYSNTGDTAYTVEVKGSKETGLIKIVASRENGYWQFKKIYAVLPRTGEVIEINPVHPACDTSGTGSAGPCGEMEQTLLNVRC